MNIITIGQQFEMGKLVAEKLGAMKADGGSVQVAIKSSDHPFWSDMVKHFSQKIKFVLRQLKTVTVAAVGAKNTADCFTNTARYYRDPSLGADFPKIQPVQPESKFTVCELTQDATFREMSESVLGVSGDIRTLSKLLKESGHTTILPVIEALVERQESGEDTGLLTNGWANFFFVDNEDGESVSVVGLDRCGRQWGVCRCPLGRDRRWDAGRRFFLRNFLGTL